MIKARWRMALAVGAFTVCVLGAALWWGRDAMAFRWRLRSLVRWNGGAYFEQALRRELPEDVVAAENWFVDRRQQTRPRLLAELRGVDLHRQVTALELLAQIDAEEGRPVDMELFWEAFEARHLTSAFLDAPPEVLVVSRVPGVHGGGTPTVQWSHSDAEVTRVWFGAVTLSPQLRTMTLRGERRWKYLRSQARLITLLELPRPVEAPPGEASILQLDYHVSHRDASGARGFELKRSLGLSAWSWMAQVVTEALESVNRPDEAEAQPYEIEAAARFLQVLLDRGPQEARLLGQGLLDHPLLAEPIRQAVCVLQGLPPASATPKETGGEAGEASPPVSPGR